MQSRKKLISYLGPKIVQGKLQLEQELDEINFCAEYSAERSWCVKHGLNVAKLKEEQRFQNLR